MADKNVTKKSTDDNSDYMAAFRNLEARVESMFHDLWQNPFSHKAESEPALPLSFKNMPRMDVIDRDKEILVKAELPGIDKQDLEVSIANNCLSIKGKSCHEEKEEKGDYLKQEISKSEVYRSLTLPADVDGDKVKTSFKNGVLKLTIPKQKSSHRKRIEIE